MSVEDERPESANDVSPVGDAARLVPGRLLKQQGGEFCWKLGGNSTRS